MSCTPSTERKPKNKNGEANILTLRRNLQEMDSDIRIQWTASSVTIATVQEVNPLVHVHYTRLGLSSFPILIPRLLL